MDNKDKNNIDKSKFWHLHQITKFKLFKLLENLNYSQGKFLFHMKIHLYPSVFENTSCYFKYLFNDIPRQ